MVDGCVSSKEIMQTVRADPHVHTVLSPCAGVEMIPPLIVQEALERGIRLIAITDHNASANIPAVMEAARGTGLTVLPGMELQTREEVHLLCLFDTLEQAFVAGGGGSSPAGHPQQHRILRRAVRSGSDRRLPAPPMSGCCSIP